MNFYPAGNVSGGSGQSLAWASKATVSATIQENVGMGGALTFANSSTTAAVTTATIIGYSTQVTAGDVNGVGGNAGQVLTNTGSGAGWANPQGGPAVDAVDFPNIALNSTYTTVLSLSVPAGSYQVMYSGDMDNLGGSTDYVTCHLQSPAGAGSPAESITLPPGVTSMIVLQGLTTTSSGGIISALCADAVGTAEAGFGGYPVLTAVQVTGISGTGIFSTTHSGQAPIGPKTKG